MTSVAARRSQLARELRLLRLLARSRSRGGEAPRVHYGVPVPPAGAPVTGPLAKLQRLAAEFPPAHEGVDVLYLASNALPALMRPVLSLARRRGIPVVWNQDGVAYPAWHGDGWQVANARMGTGIASASYVVYQSAFCEQQARRFLDSGDRPAEVLPNAVDTGTFAPAPRPERPLTLIAVGHFHQRYRYETAIRTLANLPEARLVIAGVPSWSADAEREAEEIARTAGVADRTERLGRYAQAEAPSVYARADLLLHTKVNDPCPNVVLEAMACGLPVVHSATGGTPELVGDAGESVPGIFDPAREHAPDAEALAAAVRRVAGDGERLGAAARRRAVERFDLAPWIARHRELFDEVRA